MTATRFTASGLDLTALAPSSLFPPLSFESIRTARINDLIARLNAAGFTYNVQALESDPAIYLMETGAYRELLTDQTIQDAQLSVLLAFAQGPFLDRLGDDQGTARMVVTPAVTDGSGNIVTPAVMESDARYRGRIQLAPEAYPATGTPGGYIYHAMGADTRVLDCGCAVLNQGLPSVMVALTVLSSEPGNVPSQPVLNNVYNAVYAEGVKLLTDTIAINPAVPAPYQINAILNVLPGPDTGIVLANAQAAIARQFYSTNDAIAYLQSVQSNPLTPPSGLPIIAAAIASIQANGAGANYIRLALGVPRSAIIAALSVPGVDSVNLISPAADVQTGYNQFGSLTSIAVSVNRLETPFPQTEAGSYNT